MKDLDLSDSASALSTPKEPVAENKEVTRRGVFLFWKTEKMQSAVTRSIAA